MRRTTKLLLTLAFGLSFLTFDAQTALAETAKLPLSRVAKLTVGSKATICASFNGRTYRVAKRVRGRGSVYKTTRGNAAQRSACSALGALGAVTLNSLPSTSGLVSAQATASMSVLAVSGTPPVLPDIPGLAISDLFWRPGIVDAVGGGSPSPSQCNEFLNPSSDGESSGFTGCYLVQSAASSFQNVLRSGTTLCYMKGVPSTANVSSGALSVVSGSFPSRDVTQLFSVPSGSAARVVKINASSGEGTSSIYIRVYGSTTNVSNGDLYRYQFWACEGDPEPQEYELGRVTTGGAFIVSSANTQDEGTFSGSVTGFLRRDGEALVFDTSRVRTAQSALSFTTMSSNSNVEIDGSNIVRTKSYDNFSGEIRKSFSVSRITGSSVSLLRFLDGAYKESYTGGFGSLDRQGGVEYRDTYYANAPASSHTAELSSVNFASDPFYAAINPATFDASSYSCSTTPDIELSLNLGASSMASVVAQCEGVRLDGMDFCSTDSNLQNAYSNYFTACPQ